MSQRNAFYHLFSIVRVLLYPLALIYGGVVWLRNLLYNSGFFSSIEFSVPVICVGNLSTGGTGKTPHVEYLVRLLEYQYAVATMSRGYKRRTQGFFIAGEESNALQIGDEPMQYHMKFPGLVVSVAEERITGIPALLQRRPEVEVILLDDAYQHRSVKAGLNILVTDFAKPFYDDHILPLGSLREKRNAYHRASVIIVSKCPPALPAKDAAEIERKINPMPGQKVFFSGLKYETPYNFFSREHETLIGKNIVLVCCIARPQTLVAHLKAEANDVHVLSYPDHHYFYSKDLEEIKGTVDNWKVENKVIVTTEKDATRLHLYFDHLKEWAIPVVVLPIAVFILFNKENDFHNVVLNYVDKTLSENNMNYGEKNE